MRSFYVLSLLFCLTAGACSRSSEQAVSEGQASAEGKKGSPASKPAEEIEIGNLVICRPVSYQNLTIFPVASKVAKNEDRFITLEEGLKAGTVEIFEVGATETINADDVLPAEETEETPVPQELEAAPEQQDLELEVAPPEPDEAPEQQVVEVAGDVNRLMVVCRADRPLYLMPGEVIYGGKQDRAIGEETIILADGKPKAVEVYCVEQGRWSGRSQEEAVAMYANLASDQVNVAGDVTAAGEASVEVDEETLRKLAAEANRGKFVGSAGALSKSSRATVQARKGQSAVWDQVGQANAAAGVQVDGGAFTANYADPEVIERLKGYVEKLREPVAERKQVVGAIVAVGGKIEAVDVFESTPLFKKLWPKLLKSHALDAANAAGAADPKQPKKVCTLGDAKEFLDGAMQADVEEKTTTEGGLVVTQRKSGGVVSFSAAAEDASAAGGMGMGGFGGSVHSSAFSE